MNEQHEWGGTRFHTTSTNETGGQTLLAGRPAADTNPSQVHFTASSSDDLLHLLLVVLPIFHLIFYLFLIFIPLAIISHIPLHYLTRFHTMFTHLYETMTVYLHMIDLLILLLCVD